MLDTKGFRKFAYQVVDWMADYYENIEKYPVKSGVKPGEILSCLPDTPPEQEEPMEVILKDFEEKIIPGITHWQSPDFFAYFPANSSYPSVLAEMLTATLGAQCMVWETSPAAAELEEKMMQWIMYLTGIPSSFDGVIQDTASTATLTSLLTAREQYTHFAINEKGFSGTEKFRVYASEETHSSIEKAVKIAGFGKENLVKCAVKKDFSMDTDSLREAIQNDLRRGFNPLAVVATLGTTGTTAIDPLKEITNVAKEYGLWVHVDAALAGSALILPEYRFMIEGIEDVDTFVFNAHKWLFTNFDCSLYFVKDKAALIRTFEILPEYLKTKTHGRVNDYRDWGIQLGRRFRALKLWFVLRNFGLRKMQEILREHIRLAHMIRQNVEEAPDFELLAPAPLNTVCFRYHPSGMDEETLNRINQQLMDTLNRSGKVYFTHTRLHGKFTIRFVIGQTYTREEHVRKAWSEIIRTAMEIS